MVFECAGEEDTVRESCRMAAVLGRIVVVGIPEGEDYRFEATDARRKELRAIFVRRSNLTTAKSIQWVAERKVDVACYATHRFELENAVEAMELGISKSDGVIRAIVTASD